MSQSSSPSTPLSEHTDDSDIETPQQQLPQRRLRRQRPPVPQPTIESENEETPMESTPEKPKKSRKRRHKETLILPTAKKSKKKKRRDEDVPNSSKKLHGLRYENVDEEDFIQIDVNAPPAGGIPAGRDDSPQQKSATDNAPPVPPNQPTKPVIQNINVVSKMHGEKNTGEANSHYVYVEDGLKGRFKKMQYSQLLKQRMEKTIQQQQPQEEVSTRDRREQVRLAYQELYYQLAATVLNIFSFCRGLLAGVCLMHLALTYFSNFNNFVVHFLQWYSPVSSLLLKVYMILIEISLVGAAFEVYFKLVAPLAESANGVYNPRISAPQRVLLILQFVAFLLVFFFTLGISSLDDYFSYMQSQNAVWFNDSTFLASGDFLSRLIPWHILNALRSILILVAYVVSFLSNREHSTHLQAQFKQHDAYGTHHHKEAMM